MVRLLKPIIRPPFGGAPRCVSIKRTRTILLARGRSTSLRGKISQESNNIRTTQSYNNETNAQPVATSGALAFDPLPAYSGQDRKRR